jgi:hypothetical protein
MGKDKKVRWDMSLKDFRLLCKTVGATGEEYQHDPHRCIYIQGGTAFKVRPVAKKGVRCEAKWPGLTDTDSSIDAIAQVGEAIRRGIRKWRRIQDAAWIVVNTAQETGSGPDAHCRVRPNNIQRLHAALTQSLEGEVNVSLDEVNDALERSGYVFVKEGGEMELLYNDFSDRLSDQNKKNLANHGGWLE